MYIAHPNRIKPSDHRTRHQRIDIAIGQHNEARAQRRYDLVFQAICEVRCIEETKGDPAEGMALLRSLDALACQPGRSVPAPAIGLHSSLSWGHPKLLRLGQFSQDH